MSNGSACSWLVVKYLCYMMYRCFRAVFPLPVALVSPRENRRFAVLLLLNGTIKRQGRRDFYDIIDGGVATYVPVPLHSYVLRSLSTTANMRNACPCPNTYAFFSKQPSFSSNHRTRYVHLSSRLDVVLSYWVRAVISLLCTSYRHRYMPKQ